MKLDVDSMLKRLKQAGAARGAKPSVALVVRASALELLVLDGPRVAASARVPITGDQPDRLAQAIRAAVAATGLKAKRVAVAIESPDVLFRCFTLPILPKAEWETAVPFEARRYIPFKTEVLVWDYRVIQQDAEAKRMEVVFAAIQRETFRAVEEALAAAGLQATVVEPRSVSLARLAQPAKGSGADAFVCLVDVEEDVAHLAIVKDGMPYLTRDISLLPAVKLPVAAEAAPEGAPAAEPADLRVQRLLSELSVSLDFFMRENPSTSVSRVVLCGPRQLVEPWRQWLSGKLACPVESGSGLLAPLVPGELELAFASAVGLLHAAHGREGSIDFLKRSAAKGPQAERKAALPVVSIPELAAAMKTPQAAVCAAVLAGLLGVLWVLGSANVGSVRRQLTQLKASRPDVGWGLKGMDQVALAPIKEAAAAQAALLLQVMDQRVSVAAKLDALARTLPDGVWLNGLLFEDPIDGATGQSQAKLTVHGACLLGEAGKELEAIQALEEQMKHTPAFFEGFSAAQLEQITARTGGEASKQYSYRTFQLHCDTEKIN
ncbi:MAG: pilus assembly protein PilM [Candidatus Omnitrophica bacterium]|nr:pilus assembly protein PilM [Candidatus Omnitrophota bacterium]